MADVFKIFGSIFLSDKDANSALDRTSSKFSKTFDNVAVKSGKFLDTVGKNVSKIGTTLLAGATAVGGAAVSMYIPYEENMAKIQTLVSDSKIFEGIKKNTLQLSSDLGIDATKIGDAIYQGLSSGVSEENIMDFTAKMAKLSKGGFTEMSTATDLCTSILNSYGLEIEDTNRIMDVLITTQNRGKTTVDELGSNMGRAIPTANAYGVSLEQLSAGYALMTAKGVSTAETTTYISSLFNELGKSGTQASKTLEELSGKSFSDLMKSGKSVGDVLAIMDKYAKDNNKSLSDLFGSAEAGKAALLLASEGGAAFNKELDAMKNSSGAADKAFATMDDTLKSKLEKSIQKIKNAFIKLGEKLVPIIADKIVPQIEKFTNWISNLDDSAFENMATWITWGVKVGAILAVGGKVTSWIGNITKLIGALVGGAGLSQAAGVAAGGISKLGTAGAMLSNPAGWVALGIGAVVGLTAAFIDNQKQLDENTKKFNKAADNLESFSGKVRTQKNLWTEVFGEELTIKFSADFEAAKVEVDNGNKDIIEQIKGFYQEKWNLDHDGCLDVQEHAEHERAFREAAEREHFKLLYEQRNKLSDYRQQSLTDLGEYLSTELGYTSTQIGEIQGRYTTWFNEKSAKYEENWNQINSICEKAGSQNRELTSKEQEEINRLTEENNKIQLQLTEGNAADRYNAYNAELQKERVLLDENKKAHDNYYNNLAGALYDYKSKFYEKNKEIKDAINNDKTATEEQKQVRLKALADQESALESFTSKHGQRTQELINNGVSYAEANKQSFAEIVKDLQAGGKQAEQFGMTNEEYMAMALIAMEGAGASAEDLREAILAIPKDKRAQVETIINGQDGADRLKNTIDNINSKTITVTTKYVVQGGQYMEQQFKGTEGYLPRRAFGDESLFNSRSVLVGEQGPEIVQLPAGAKVKTHRETNALTGSQPIICYVQVDGRTIATATAPYMDEALTKRARRESW